MKKYIILLAIFLTVKAQSQTTFQKIYKNPNVYEIGEDYCISSDGNYMVAGYHTDDVNSIAFLMNTNVFGDIIWIKEYPGLDGFSSITQTLDGGYAIAGFSDSLVHGNWDFFILRTDGLGNTLWCKFFDFFNYDFPYYIIQDQDEGFFITGSGSVNLISSPNGFIIKTDSTGSILWNKIIPAAGNPWPVEVANVTKSNDGNTIATGTYVVNNETRLMLIKFDSLGQTIWKRCYGSDFYGRVSHQTSDGGFITSGFGSSPGILNGSALLKSDSIGNMQWCKIFSNGYSIPDLIINSDGDYVMAGTYQSTNDSTNIYLIKINVQGDTIWTRFYGLDPQLNYTGVSAYNILQTPDGGYLVGGSATKDQVTHEDIYILKTDAEGMAGCNLVYRPITIESVTPALDTNIMFTSGVITTSVQTLSTISQILDTTLCLIDRINEYENLFSLDVYPNPATDLITLNTSAFTESELSLEVKDLMGRTVIHKKVPTGKEVDVDVSILAKGIYVVTLSGNKSIGKKVFCIQ